MQAKNEKKTDRFFAIIPAAGIGSRMGLTQPKQYCQLSGKTVLEHSMLALLSHPLVAHVVVAVHPDDQQFEKLRFDLNSTATTPLITTVLGGETRADSVLAALKKIVQIQDSKIGMEPSWSAINAVMIHDAARPCLSHSDIDQLINAFHDNPKAGALLANPVRDTMKRTNDDAQILTTVDRQNLWHALTPQLFLLDPLMRWLEKAISEKLVVTDEASVFELNGVMPQLVPGRTDNIKITYYEDLLLADFYLKQRS